MTRWIVLARRAALLAGALSIAGLLVVSTSWAISTKGGGLLMGKLFVNPSGDVCITIRNLSGPDPVTFDLTYVRAPKNTMLSRAASSAPALQTTTTTGETLPLGAEKVFCATPSASGGFCNGFFVEIAGVEVACRSVSEIHIPVPLTPPPVTGMVTVTVGDAAPVGATSIDITVVPISIPAGTTVTVPSSVAIPSSGNTATFDIEVDRTTGPPSSAKFDLQFTFDTETDFFAEYEVTASTPVPALSAQGAIAFLLLVTGAALVVWRRRARRMNE